MSRTRKKASVLVHFTPETRPYRKVQVVEGYGPIDRGGASNLRKYGKPPYYDTNDREWDDFDEILGNFGDWGDQ